MDATSWATFFALLSLLIFIGIAIYVKAPAMVAKSLDERAGRIRGVRCIGCTGNSWPMASVCRRSSRLRGWRRVERPRG